MYIYIYVILEYFILSKIMLYFPISSYMILCNPMKSCGVNRPTQTHLPQWSNPWFAESSTTKIANPWSSPSDRLCPPPGQIRHVVDCYGM